jgi:hypothetical protein
LLAAVCGLALLTGLTVYYGFGAVMTAIASSGWATVLVVAARAAALAGAGIGRWALVPARQPGPSAFVLLRFVREAINSFFPVAVIGGDVIGARLLARFGLTRNWLSPACSSTSSFNSSVYSVSCCRGWASCSA